MTTDNLLQRAVAAFLEALQPILDAAAGDEPARQALLQILQLPPDSTAVVPAIDVASLESYLTEVDPGVESFVLLALTLQSVFTTLKTFVGGPNPGDATAYLAGEVTIQWLRRRHPKAYALARIVQLIESNLTDHYKETLFVERAGNLLTDVGTYFKNAFTLQNEADAQGVSDVCFTAALGLAAWIDSSLKSVPLRPFYRWDAPPTPGLPASTPQAPNADAVSDRTLTIAITGEKKGLGAEGYLFLTFILIPAEHDGGEPGLLLCISGDGKLEGPLSKDKKWTLTTEAELSNAVSLWWRFHKGIQLDSSPGLVLKIEVGRKADPFRKPLSYTIFTGTKLTMDDLRFTIEASSNDVDARVAISDAALAISPGLVSLFDHGLHVDFDLVLGYSIERGFYVGGGAGLSAVIDVNRTIGAVHLQSVALDVHYDSGRNSLGLGAGLTLTVKIGPVKVSVEGIGVRADIRFPPQVNDPGFVPNFGTFDLGPAFQWPSGAGILIDAGAITGGGFLYFDKDNGRYAGALQLDMRGIAVSAVGVLDTKLPGGQSGYSFVIIISAEFSPVQLGLGFTLNGVGGLVGIHRTVAVEPLQSAVRGHAIDDLLFPKNAVVEAPRIIGELQGFFPVEADHFVFGPMALIGWGTPTLVTIELGILIELPPPVRIILLGQLDCTLPRADAAVIELHVDVLGVLDFGAKFFALDGTLHDSRVGPFTLCGDFAVRLRWGDAPSFALSVGGFHPHFLVPPKFPSLRRITLALSSSNNPRLTLQCYLALTSNSLQFGARADLYAAAGSFNISGWVGFDVLVIYRPFSFRADLTAGFALRRNSRFLAGIQVDATITGPAPWHVWGEATFSILFFDISVGFDATFGDAVSTPPVSVNLWVALGASIREDGNWSAMLPPSAARVVSQAHTSLETRPLLDPVGNITLLQREAPFNRTNTKFREASPEGPKRFDLSSVTISQNIPNSGTVTETITGWIPVQESFAPAQVEQLSDDQKLSRPSFEKMVAGVALPDLVTIGAPIGSNITYTTVIRDSVWAAHAGADYTLFGALQLALQSAGAAALGGTRNAGTAKYTTSAPPRIALVDESYVIAAAADLVTRPDLGAPATKSDAFAHLEDYLAAHPAERGMLVVISEEEAA